MSTKKQPEQLIFFIDRCLGNHDVPEALENAGATAQIHDNIFSRNAPDEVWIPEVGRKKWVAITKDRFGTAQKVAVEKAKLRVFTLTRRDLRGPVMAEILVKALPRIERISRTTRGPFIAKVYLNGGVTMWWMPRKKRKKRTPKRMTAKRSGKSRK